MLVAVAVWRQTTLRGQPFLTLDLDQQTKGSSNDQLAERGRQVTVSRQTTLRGQPFASVSPNGNGIVRLELACEKRNSWMVLKEKENDL